MKIINAVDILRNILFKKIRLYKFLIPKVVIITFTGKCNARCIMCNIWRDKSRKKDLTLEEYKKIFSESQLLEHASIITITGGEPFLREDIVNLVKFLCKKLKKLEEIRFATNGFLPDKIERDFKEMVKLKCRFNVKVSIDGLRDTHNEIRGRKDAFELAETTINKLLTIKKENKNLDIAIAHTMMPKNINETVKVYDYFNDKGVDFICKIIFHAKSFSNENVKLLNKWQMKQAISNLRYIHKKEQDKLKNIGLNFKKIKNISYLLFLEYLIKLLSKCPEKKLVECHSTFSSVTFESDGRVFSCGMIYLPLGDLRKEKFDKIWLNEKNDKIRDFINDGKCKCSNTCDTIPSLVMDNFPAVLRKFLLNK